MDFIRHYLSAIGIDDEYTPQLLANIEKLRGIPLWNALTDHFSTTDYLGSSTHYLGMAAELAAPLECHAYTAHLMFFICCAEHTLLQYRARGLAEEIYWESMRDLRYKYAKCVRNHGIHGTFVGDWHVGFFRVARFGLGRLQFEYTSFSHPEAYTFGNFTLRPNDRAIFCHIPASGPLTREARLDAYKRAYEFFRRDFTDGVLPIVTDSWLLHKEHYKMLPASSNIVDFMNDFDILSFRTYDGFPDAWRVFGPDATKPPQEWPRDTTFRRAYADLLMNGGTGGAGYGILLFDGEKILNRVPRNYF